MLFVFQTPAFLSLSHQGPQCLCSSVSPTAPKLGFSCSNPRSFVRSSPPHLYSTTPPPVHSIPFMMFLNKKTEHAPPCIYIRGRDIDGLFRFPTLPFHLFIPSTHSISSPPSLPSTLSFLSFLLPSPGSLLHSFLPPSSDHQASHHSPPNPTVP